MIKDFFVQNWYYLALLVLAICNMVFLIFRKPKVVQKDILFAQVLQLLPIWIKESEALGGSGEVKKCRVITEAIKYMAQYSDVKYSSCNEVDFSAIDRIGEEIEKILSTPEKKGDK